MRAWEQGNTLSRFRMHRRSQEEGIHEQEKQNTLALNYERKG